MPTRFRLLFRPALRARRMPTNIKVRASLPLIRRTAKSKRPEGRRAQPISDSSGQPVRRTRRPQTNQRCPLRQTSVQQHGTRLRPNRHRAESRGQQHGTAALQGLFGGIALDPHAAFDDRQDKAALIAASFGWFVHLPALEHKLLAVDQQAPARLVQRLGNLRLDGRALPGPAPRATRAAGRPGRGGSSRTAET